MNSYKNSKLGLFSLHMLKVDLYWERSSILSVFLNNKDCLLEHHI